MAHNMLNTAPMSRSVLALVLVATSASAASAGGFVGLGIGTGAATSGDINIDEHGRSGRLMAGYRFGRISVEGMGSRYGMVSQDAHEWTATTLALAGRYNLPLQDSFEVFGRLGLQRTDITGDYYDEDLVGTGFLLGAGAEFRLPTAAVAVSLFVDYTILRTGVKPWGEGPTDYGLTSRIWTLGATLSF
jgi:outer membrane protein with beta-barrel domain